ncbi:MAG TPA: heavy metal translocating P-type ATPase [Vicinamibacterales bacterium]|nr:heavy metal translocating P-type ATPase [Vicinamibacterales bacterium]
MHDRGGAEPAALGAQRRGLVERGHAAAAALALAGVAAHLILRFVWRASPAIANAPLLAVLAIAGTPLVGALLWRAAHGEFGSDHLAGISIVTSVLLHQYLAGAIVVLMLAGGNALEQMAVARAASVLRALAKRVPTVAHRRAGSGFHDVPVEAVQVGDALSMLPHEICPVDGEVIEGHGAMDESYLTGEPFTISKGPGSTVLSGAVNGESSLAIRTTRVAADSRFARIMRVMRDAEQRRPAMRRIGDELGTIYTPVALVLAAAAWWWSGQPERFLSVVIVATPCPLIIAIPVAIIGAISTAARRGIIVRDPAALEQMTLCTTMILDKTGTLTYGRPALSAEHYAPEWSRDRVLPLVASLERYSRHPLAGAIVRAAEDARCPLPDVERLHERPGSGLAGRVGGHDVAVTSRARTAGRFALPPEETSGLECVILVDDRYAATYRFHDVPRPDSRGFVVHLGPRHGFTRVLLVSGDREAEARRLAQSVAITDVYGATSPEDKVEIVQLETSRAKTLFVGDGVNDAPALLTATVGVAFGQQSDVATEAAGVVVIDTSLSKVDELIHISRRLRRVALQSAIGGMALSLGGMLLAAAGMLTPIAGAVLQEGIDLAAVLNALRTARGSGPLSDLAV